MEFAKTELVTLVEFKTEVEIWHSKGVDNPVFVGFESGDMILIVRDYVYPDKAYFISVPFNDNSIFCLGDTGLNLA